MFRSALPLVLFLTVVVFGIATGEDQKELAQLIVDTEAEFANLNTLKNWDQPKANIYSSLAAICSKHLEILKQRYIKQFNVNLDQYPGTTFPVSTKETTEYVTKPTTRQSIGFDQESAVTRAAERSQEIVNQQVTCDQFEQKKEGDNEPCRKKLNCMKKKYMEENRFTFSDHPTDFPIRYKGEYASMTTPPKDIECEESAKPRRKRTPDNRKSREKSNIRKRRTSEYPVYTDTSMTRRRTLYNPVYGKVPKTRRRRAPEYQEYEKSKIRRRRTLEYPAYGEKPMTRRKRTAENADNKPSEEVFPFFADKWTSKINSPKLKTIYEGAKKGRARRPKGDSQSEMRRNLAVGLKTLIHAAILYRHSYDPVKDHQSPMSYIEIRVVDWLASKLVDTVIKKSLRDK